MCIIRPFSLSAFGSLRKTMYPSNDSPQDSILRVRRDSEKLNTQKGREAEYTEGILGEGYCVVGNLANITDVQMSYFMTIS